MGYLNEYIKFGGELVLRGEAYDRLVRCALADGFSDREALRLADRWFQGYNASHPPVSATHASARGNRPVKP